MPVQLFSVAGLTAYLPVSQQDLRSPNLFHLFYLLESTLPIKVGMPANRFRLHRTYSGSNSL